MTHTIVPTAPSHTLIRYYELTITCRDLATRARRGRLTICLDTLRHIGAQLDALDPSIPEAFDLLVAIEAMLRVERSHIDRLLS